jgi:hypothetical protein
MSMISELPRWLHARARRVLPATLRTVSAEVQASCTSLTALLLPLRRPSAGSVLFHLDAETCRRMQRDPASVLDQTVRAARPCGHGCYRPWRSVRAPAPLGMVHFTTRRDDRAWLVVVPEDATALYVWR